MTRQLAMQKFKFFPGVWGADLQNKNLAWNRYPVIETLPCEFLSKLQMFVKSMILFPGSFSSFALSTLSDTYLKQAVFGIHGNKKKTWHSNIQTYQSWLTPKYSELDIIHLNSQVLILGIFVMCSPTQSEVFFLPGSVVSGKKRFLYMAIGPEMQ